MNTGRTGLSVMLLVVLASTSACGPPTMQAANEARDTAYGVAVGVEYVLREEMDPDERIDAVRQQFEESEQLPGASKTLYGSHETADTATFDLAFDASAQTSGGFVGEQAFVRLCVSLVVALQGPVDVRLEDAPCAGPTALTPDDQFVEVDLQP